MGEENYQRMMELNKIFNEDCRETMARMPDNFIDSIVTDPPYELGFMGKKWDSSGIAYNVDLWKECFRVLKPGGFLLAFGGTRTSHRVVCSIEDAGFEIRNSIIWIFGQGYPKSGSTQLKPAHEPICVARKPLSEKNVEENVLKWGTGKFNIDECRIATSDKLTAGSGGLLSNVRDNKSYPDDNKFKQSKLGRFPANVIFDEFTADLLDKQMPNAGAFAPVKRGSKGKSKNVYGDFKQKGDDGASFYEDLGGPSKFFYCAKADRIERNAGLEQFKEKPLLWSSGTKNPGSFQSDGTKKASQNNHPTVKPVKLIQYLCKLVTPKGGIIYDPFGGSGTTAVASINEGFFWILSEIVPEYCDITNKRIYHNGGLFL